MKVYALSGFKGSGKDSLASYLMKNFNAWRVSFADPLKDMASLEYGVDRGAFDDPDRKEAPILSLPLDPQDLFTRMVSEFMVKEFRTSTGASVQEFGYVGGKFYGLVDDWGPKPVKLFHTPRSLAILKGSTNRVVRSNFWVQKAISEIKDRYEDLTSETFVISDLRYNSEIGQLREAFGNDLTTIRINRFEKSPSSDPSEMDLVGVKHDYEIDNTGTLAEAERQMGVIALKDVE